MHYLKAKFNSSIQGAFAIPSVSLCQVWVRGNNSRKGEARLVLSSRVGLDTSLQQMLYLCLLTGLGWLSIWLLCPCMFVWNISVQRACPSTNVESPGWSPFGSKHNPAEVSLNKTVNPVQFQGHNKVAGGLKKTNSFLCWSIDFLVKDLTNKLSKLKTFPFFFLQSSKADTKPSCSHHFNIPFSLMTEKRFKEPSLFLKLTDFLQTLPYSCGKHVPCVKFFQPCRVAVANCCYNSIL